MRCGEPVGGSESPPFHKLLNMKEEETEPKQPPSAGLKAFIPSNNLAASGENSISVIKDVHVESEIPPKFQNYMLNCCTRAPESIK